MRAFAFNDGTACGWYRIKLPFQELARHGHDVRTELAAESDGPAGDEDIVVGQRLDNPGALPSWRRWSAASRLVYEIDDDVFHVDPVNWLAWKTYQHEIPKDTAMHAAQVADLVTVSTGPLAEVMRAETGQRNIVVLPNYVDASLLEVERPRRERVTVGWTGGVSHGRDMALVAPQVRRFLRRNPAVDLHVIGTDFREVLLGRGQQVRARWTDWSDDLQAYYHVIDFDIGLAPLHPTVFARSKSWIKALEYAALGIPVIASDLEPYREFVLDGVTGYLVRREHEWGRRLYELTQDETMRTEMGAKAREHAAGFTIQRNWRQWEHAYQSIL